MESNNLAHPSPNQLAAFASGQAPAESTGGLRRHLAECAACRTTVDTIIEDSQLLRQGQRPVPNAKQSPHEVATITGPTTTSGATTPVPASLAEHPRYRILELLGAGGMGAVYKAEHRRMERHVALKVMSPDLMDRPEMVERFHREVKAAALLTHPNIVTAYDADQAGDTHFLIMEFVEGISLAQKVQQEGPLPVAQACAYVRQAALGLQHAFERGMVHRDVKPHNLMLTPTGPVKVLDFGLARFVRETASVRAETDAATTETAGPAARGTASALTETGTLMGTADFIAPEQSTDPSGADVRADVYSLGCTLYYLLAGHAPFPEGTALDKLVAHCEQAPAPLTGLRRDVPPALARVVERMMAKGPAQRYQTPAEVTEALTLFLSEASSSRRGTRRLLAVAVAVGTLALLAGAVIYVWNGNPFSLERSGREGVPEKPPTAGLSPVVAAPEKVGKIRRPAQGEGVPAKYREAIDKGLAYLARTQGNDGHWEANGGQYPVALTALASMAMLMEGSTLGEGKHADSIRKAVNWLMKRKQPDGLLDDPNHAGEQGRYLFGHGYAMLFLATVYGQEEDVERRQKLEKILTKAVEYTGNAQSSRSGWGYVSAAEGGNFDEGASTEAQLQGLRAARNAGIVVPKKLIDIDYLRKCTTPDGGIIYSLSGGGGGQGRPPLTAAALACMFTAGEYDSDLARKWIKFCQQTIPNHKPEARMGHDEYTQYYYAQALYILGDKGYEKLFPGSKPAEQLTWSKYRETTFDAILARQGVDGGWNGPIGPVYSTACYLTVLQLDNGALQIYQR